MTGAEAAGTGEPVVPSDNLTQGASSWVVAYRRDLRPHPEDGPGTGPVRLITVEQAGPSVAVAGPYAVFFDGLLYNSAELGVPRDGARSDDQDMASVVLAAYRRFGGSVLEKLKGRFALVLWDGRTEKLICVRDQVGSHPLFYTEAAGVLLVSPSSEELVRHPQVPAALNRVALAADLAYLHSDREETVYTSVKRVPPGWMLRVAHGGRPTASRYWDPIPPDGDVDWIREDPLERFDEVFERAVTRCLGREQAGIFLSGGLDSGSVAALAADRNRALGRPASWALSLVFPHPDCNEEKVQRQVARQLGMPQVLVGFEEAVGSRGLMLAGLELSPQMPAPLDNFWIPAYDRLVREAKERGCQVVLTGGGGDEWLMVSPYLAADMLRRLDLAGVWRLWRNYARFSRISLPRSVHSIWWRFGLRPLLDRAGRSALEVAAPWALRARWRGQARGSMPGWLAPDPALRQELEERAVRMRAEPHPSNLYLWESRRALDHPLVSLEYEEEFERDRRTGVPTVEPFLDPDVIDLLCRMPPDTLNVGGRSKGLVRGMLERRFPEAGFERQRKVSATSFVQTLVGVESARAWKETGGVGALAQMGIMDQSLFADEVGKVNQPRKRRAISFRVPKILNAEVWVRWRL